MTFFLPIRILYEYKIIYMAIPYNTVKKQKHRGTCCKGRKWVTAQHVYVKLIFVNIYYVGICMVCIGILSVVIKVNFFVYVFEHLFPTVNINYLYNKNNLKKIVHEDKIRILKTRMALHTGT